MPAPRHAGLLTLTVAALLAPTAPALARDRNGDGLPDRWQKRHHVKGAARDADRDGLSNRYEWLSKTKPRKADSDRDGTPDAREDRDRDGLDNGSEQRRRTNPRKADSDRDGLADGAELEAGLDPLARDTDFDGLLDGEENAGIVQAAEGAVVTVARFGGGALTGTVTEETDLLCAVLDEVLDGEDEEWVDGEDDEWVDDEEWVDEEEEVLVSAAALHEDLLWDCDAGVAPGARVYEATVAGGAFTTLDLVGE